MIEKKGKLVSRNFSEVSTDTEGVLIGTPIVYDSPTIIGGLFEETVCRGAIQPGAITKDTALYYNHDTNTKPLCRVRTGKLNLTDSDEGIRMEAHLNLERSDCKDLYLAVRDGDIDKMSFCFRVEEDDWDFESNPSMPKRSIKKISYIKEVSAVDDPAYADTALYARKGEAVETDSVALENARAEYIRSKEETDEKVTPEEELVQGISDEVSEADDKTDAEESTPDAEVESEANAEVEEDRANADEADVEARKALDLAKAKALLLLQL